MFPDIAFQRSRRFAKTTPVIAASPVNPSAGVAREVRAIAAEGEEVGLVAHKSLSSLKRWAFSLVPTIMPVSGRRRRIAR